MKGIRYTYTSGNKRFLPYESILDLVYDKATLALTISFKGSKTTNFGVSHYQSETLSQFTPVQYEVLMVCMDKNRMYDLNITTESTR